MTNCFLLLVGVYCNNPLIRKTTNGPVEGIKKKSSMGKYYYAFLGIPFAEPPINDLRFKVLNVKCKRLISHHLYIFHATFS